MSRTAKNLKAALGPYTPHQRRLIMRYLVGESYTQIDNDTGEGRETLRQLCRPFQVYRLKPGVQEIVASLVIDNAINLPIG